MSVIKKLFIVIKGFITSTIREMKECLNGDTYYPELPRKSKVTRFKELLKWLIKYKEVNRFYNLYGFDTHETDEGYLNYNRFMKTRDNLNNLRTTKSSVALLRDKYLFYKIMKGFNLPVPEVFGVIRNGKVLDADLKPLKSDVFKSKKDYFVKSIDGECASCVEHIKDYNDFCEKVAAFEDDSLILQKRVFQSKEMNLINPNAINTVRIVTVRTSDGIKVLSTVLRVGTVKSGGVDNWAAGGISVGVDDNGYLEEFGYYKPGYGGRVSVHPDTGVIFKEFQISDFDKVKKCVCNAHKCFYGIHSIGWDIAVTEDGPVFIEGNDNWEISLMQACNHGLRKDWENACRY